MLHICNFQVTQYPRANLPTTRTPRLGPACGDRPSPPAPRHLPLKTRSPPETCLETPSTTPQVSLVITLFIFMSSASIDHVLGRG